MKTFFHLNTLILSLVFFSGLHAQDYITHHFNDGSFYPYVVPKADQESRVNIVNKRVETHWDQSLYNGTNSGRKAQIKQAAGDHSDDEVRFTQHIWMGFWLKIHGDYMKDNTNTHAGLMQIWGYNPNGSANHMCMLKFDGRNGGALVWQHRYNSVANKTHHLIYPNFPKEQFVRVVMHVKLAEPNNGLVQVWVDDQLMLNESNQTIAWGDQDATGMINGTYCFGTSIGQYNYLENAAYDDAYDGDNHWFDGHMAGETRTVTYDKVSLYNGEYGYSLVDPNGGANPSLSTKEFTTSSLNIFPNPIESILNIQGLRNSKISLYDINGRTLLTKDLVNESEKLDISHLENGAYYLKTDVGTKIIVKK